MCRLAGFNPDIAHQVPTTEAVVGIVACGEGVAILPSSAERLRMKGVSFRPLDMRRIPDYLRDVRFGLAWCKDSASATALRFVELVAKSSNYPSASPNGWQTQNVSSRR